MDNFLDKHLGQVSDTNLLSLAKGMLRVNPSKRFNIEECLQILIPNKYNNNCT